MENYIDFKRLKQLSDNEKQNVNMPYKIIKLQEEAGEIAAEFLKLSKTKNASKSAEGTKESFIEECFDLLNVISDIINVSIETEEDKEFAKYIAEKKLNKWKSKQQTLRK